MGMAVRMALGLGLHREFADPVNTNTLGMEIRRRIWWTLYILDVGAGVTFGRPTIPSDKVTTKIPLNVFDDVSSPAPPEPCTIISYPSLLLVQTKARAYSRKLRPSQTRRCRCHRRGTV